MYQRHMISANLETLTPLTFLAHSAATFPDRIAAVHGERRLSYRALEDLVHRMAGALRASGLKAGETVSFLCPNIPEMLAAHFAVPLAGGVLGALLVAAFVGPA